MSLPQYDQVKSEHVVPGVRALLKQLHAEIDALEASVEPTWEGLVAPLERIADRHQRIWGIVGHLKVGCNRWAPPAVSGEQGLSQLPSQMTWRRPTKHPPPSTPRSTCQIALAASHQYLMLAHAGREGQ